MKKFSILALLFLSACGQSDLTETENTENLNLPNEIITTDEGFNALKQSIHSDFPNLKEEIEVMEFYYSSRISPSDDELSSLFHLQFVKGDNKDVIVEYSIDNDGLLSNGEMEITIGKIGDEKISNKYETYKPFLFSSKLIDLGVIRKCISSSINQFKEDTNCSDAYCSSMSVEYDNRGDLEISINIKQKQFSTTLSRYYDWTIEGKPKK